jgi:hypothetical protein
MRSGEKGMWDGSADTVMERLCVSQGALGPLAGGGVIRIQVVGTLLDVTGPKLLFVI